MRSYDQLCDGSNLIRTISYHNLSQSRLLINHLSPDLFNLLVNLLNQPFKSSYAINLLNQSFELTYAINLFIKSAAPLTCDM